MNYFRLKEKQKKEAKKAAKEGKKKKIKKEKVDKEELLEDLVPELDLNPIVPKVKPEVFERPTERYLNENNILHIKLSISMYIYAFLVKI